MSSRARRLVLLLALLGGCQKDINHHPANIAVTSLVTLGNLSQQGNGSSTGASITPDGRYVAFSSTATNLISGVTVTKSQVYRRDLATGATILISVDSSGMPGDQDSDSPSISADGRRIAFRSLATNFSSDANPNLVTDVYLRDLTGPIPETRLLSGAAAGGPNDGFLSGCFSPAVSQDGNFVAFISDASNLGLVSVIPALHHAFRVPATGGPADVVDLLPDGSLPGAAVMSGLSISADGRYIAFDSTEEDLGSPGPPTVSCIFVRDMSITVAAVELASPSLDPTAIDPFSKGSVFPSISADGRVIAFHSFVQNLVPDDTNGTAADVFVRDLRGLIPRTLLVSRNSLGINGTNDSTRPALAADGNSVAFLSISINLISDDFNGVADVFWHDLRTGKTVRVSVNTAQQEAPGSARDVVSITADGRFVAFTDSATNLVTGDLNGADDVFIRGPLY